MTNSTKINVTIRKATEADIPSLKDLMEASMRGFGEGHYTSDQIESCCHYVCVPDQQLIEDGTFFIAEDEEGTMIGCGGWSYRNTLYAGPKTNTATPEALDPTKDAARIRAMFTHPHFGGQGIGSKIMQKAEEEMKAQGFTKGCLGSTLSGYAFYKAKGWNSLEEEQATLPDGVKIGVVKMDKTLSYG